MPAVKPEELYRHGRLGLGQLKRLAQLFGAYLAQTQRPRFHLEIAIGYAICLDALRRHARQMEGVVTFSRGERERLLQAMIAYALSPHPLCPAQGW